MTRSRDNASAKISAPEAVREKLRRAIRSGKPAPGLQLESNSLEAAKELGASVVLRKPYDPDEMLVAVSTLLSQAPA
jgi:DNA-binding GntR family transcriptional regulator